MIETGPTKPRAARPSSSAVGEATQDGSEVGVDDGRRRALELAPDRSDPVRDRHGDAREPLVEERGEASLVLRVRVPEEEADGDRNVDRRCVEEWGEAPAHSLELGVGQRRHHRPVRADPLADADAIGPGDERLGLGPVEVVRVLLVDAPDRRHVLEARRREQQHARPAPLEQRIRADGRAEGDRGDGRRLDPRLLEAVEDRLRRGSRGRGPLADHDHTRLVVEDDEVGEGASGVDAGVQRHRSALRLPRIAVPRQPVLGEERLAVRVAEVRRLTVRLRAPHPAEQRSAAETARDGRGPRPIEAQRPPLAHGARQRTP